MNYYRDFSGGPVVKSLRFHCMSCEFKPWSGRSYRQCGQKKKKKELLQKSLIHKEHSSSFFGWCICLPHNTKLCKGREHDLLINILLVPSSNAWHKVVTQLSCGRINVEQSSPHIHIKQCPKPFPVWSNSSSTITLEQYSNFFTVGHRENLCCLVYLYFNGITTFHAWVLWENWLLASQEEGHNDSS